MRVIKSESVYVRPQYWEVQLECGHKQEVHSTRNDGPLYVRRCRACEESADNGKG